MCYFFEKMNYFDIKLCNHSIYILNKSYGKNGYIFFLLLSFSSFLSLGALLGSSLRWLLLRMLSV